MYGKFFASCFTGSMFGSGPEVFAVWAYVIANTKKDSHVELNAKMLAASLGCEVSIVSKAIDFLCAPDAESRSKLEEGRRLVKVGEYLYEVVNHQHYQNIRNEDDRRAYNRQKKAESRARNRSVKASVNDKSTNLSISTSIDTSGKGDWGKPPSVQLLVTVSTAMQADGFPEAWADWLGYSEEKGHPLTSYTARRVMMRCEKWGPKLAKTIIDASMEKNWKNLIDPADITKQNGFSANNKPTPGAQIRRAAAPLETMQ